MLLEGVPGAAGGQPGRSSSTTSRTSGRRSNATLVDTPPALARDGGAIRDGVDPELDELRHVSRSGKEIIARMEEPERARTGIASLKIRYNRVFGYYIEVSKSNLHAVPADYHRKQTIAGGERFITPELKEYEEKVLGADERILEREIEIFERLRAEVAAESPRVQDTARALAALDVLAALAETAAANNYTKPHVHDGDEIVGRRRPPPGGRAPLPRPVRAERHPPGRHIASARDPDRAEHGRQIDLPAAGGADLPDGAGGLVRAGAGGEARRWWTASSRASGASDNIARGQSTFMVEMQETANILHSATSRSLVILDEIGRGTATFDGLSIAWAVAEHLASSPRARPKTLFATHYHELTDLADGLPGVVNYHVDAREWHEDIVFLRKVVPGRSDRSYGIQVARLAGLPWAVVARAREILDALEHDELARGGRPSLAPTPTEPQQQLGLFQAPSPGRPDCRAAASRSTSNRLTPLEALALLAELKRDAGYVTGRPPTDGLSAGAARGSRGGAGRRWRACVSGRRCAGGRSVRSRAQVPHD